MRERKESSVNPVLIRIKMMKPVNSKGFESLGIPGCLSVIMCLVLEGRKEGGIKKN